MNSNFPALPGAKALLFLACALVGACAQPNASDDADESHASDDASTTSSDSGTPSARLSPAAALERISVSIRGIRPSAEEIAAVDADPESLGQIAANYVASPESSAWLADLHNEALLVRVSASIFPLGFAARGEVADRDVQGLNLELIGAPFALIDHVIRDDLPYSTIVTADYVMANASVAAVWGLPYNGDGPSYVETRFADVRPHAGILSDPLLLTRHYTTYSNLNRGRANMVARALLCEDFLHREVEVDSGVDFGDQEAVAHAISNHPACVACHQTLDPLAAYFAPMRPIFLASQVESYPVQSYFPELTSVFAATKPGYFGFPGGDLRDLGSAIAQDPRFAACTVERTFAYLHQSERGAMDPARRAELIAIYSQRESFRDLVVAIVTHADFLAARGESGAAQARPQRDFYLRPWQLAKHTTQATGFRWTAELTFDLGWGNLGTFDLLGDSLFGFEALAGGIDSQQSVLPSLVPTPSRVLVERELANRAALFAVNRDFANPEKALLLPGVDEAQRDPEILAHLGQTLFPAFVNDQAHQEAIVELFAAALLENGGDRQSAYQLVLATLLRDPSRLIY
jgi:hypothetical protein